jgi:hypothetical protein
MRGYLILSAVLLAATSAPIAAEQDCRCFTPTAENIRPIEEGITDLPDPIYRYARYYAGVVLPPEPSRGQGAARRRVLAEFVPSESGEPPAIHIVEDGRLPPLHGEGCIANRDIPPMNNAFEIYARCNRPGGWRPSTAEIAELERRLALPSGTAPLARYARHYAGVTESGVRLIKGVLLDAADSAPGIVVESEIELPLIEKDGCAGIEVDYNPETTLASVRCHKTD